jgi:hypothetical protein
MFIDTENLNLDELLKNEKSSQKNNNKIPNEKINNDDEETQLFYYNELYKDIFDWEKYIEKHADLKKAGYKTKKDAWRHWINNGLKENRKLFLLDNESGNENTKSFDWKKYIEHYGDLREAGVKTIEQAWLHWLKYGIKEKRQFFINNSNNSNNNNSLLLHRTEIKIGSKASKELVSASGKNDNKDGKKILFDFIQENNHQIIIKKKYDDYGLHYFGWKGVMKSFLGFIKAQKILSKIIVSKNILFDEWIEKLLFWGNKIENEELIKEVFENDYNLISFIHNPPYENYIKCEDQEKKELEKHVLLNDSVLNKNVLKMLETINLESKIVYLYTLSVSHKKYIYKNYPNYRNKLVSVYHPIDLNSSNMFDYTSFEKNKRIFHIGWWLRNFKTFVDLNIPCQFQKYILVKKSFEKKWLEMSKDYDLRTIEVLYNLSNPEYEKIFKDSCIFLDLEDAVANNVILECVRFCTPIIVKKLDSVVEYLGPDYPLYFSNEEDLKHIESYSNEEFLNIVLKAHQYLVSMDKTHLQLDTFNKKIVYDLKKLDVIENKKNLTWFCFLKMEEDLDFIHCIIEQFLNQEFLDKIYLTFVIYKNELYFEKMIDLLEEYKEKNSNISYILFEGEEDNNLYDDFYLCMNSATTDYFTIVNIHDLFEKKYSYTFIQYLETHYNCDIGFTSFIIRNVKDNNEKLVYYEKNVQLFIHDVENQIFVDSGFVWRTNINTIIEKNISMKNNSMKDIIKECLKLHLNLCCVSNELLCSIEN